MTIDELLKNAREIWSHKMTDQEIAVAMGVVYGDICRHVRDHAGNKTVDEAEIKKELGNMLFSTIRWADDLGFSPEECIELAKAAQQRYIKK